MVEHSIPAGKMYRAPEVPADPHFAARDAIVDVEAERPGTIRMLRSPNYRKLPARHKDPGTDPGWWA